MFGLGKEETLTIHVEGMMCEHCAKRVSEGLRKRRDRRCGVLRK